MMHPFSGHFMHPEVKILMENKKVHIQKVFKKMDYAFNLICLFNPLFIIIKHNFIYITIILKHQDHPLPTVH